jgi:hypothetical protein
MTVAVAKQTRAAMRKRLAQIAMRINAIHPRDDEKFPAEHQVTRQRERAALVREWTQVESQYAAEMAAWHETQRNTAARKRSEDPILDAAHESRRVSENLEIAGLAQPLIGAGRTQIKRSLHDEAKRFLALDMPDKARIYLEAAKRAGYEDPTLAQAYEDALDRTVPARREARAIETAAQDQMDLFDNDRYSMRLVHGVGDQVRASTAAKMLAARRGEPVPVGMLDGAHGEAQINAAAKDAGTAQ